MRFTTIAILLGVSTISACSDVIPPAGTTPTQHALSKPSFAATDLVIVRDADRSFNSKAASATDNAGAEGWSTIESEYPSFRIVNDNDAPRSPSSVAQVSFASGAPGGVTQGLAVKSFPSGGYQSVKLTFYARLSSTWAGPQNGSSELAELTIGGQTAVRLIASGVGSQSLWPIAVLADGVPDARTKLTANIDPTWPAARDMWQRWDLEARLNTPGVADGRVSWSLDGVLVGQYDNVMLIAAPSAFDAYRQATIWGTSADQVFTSMWVRYDHATIDGGVASTSTIPGSPPGDPMSQPDVNECDTPSAAWLFCDDFETSRIPQYFQFDGAFGNFARIVGVGIDSSSAMRARWRAGQSSAGSLRLAFGNTPSTVFRPVDAGTANYRELYWRFYLRYQPGWIGGASSRLSRAMVMANSDWSAAASAHVWGADEPFTDHLGIDPASGTDEEGTLTGARYSDFANLRWLGAAHSQTPFFDDSHVGQWYCVESHVRLNDAGMSNGTFDVRVNGALEAQRTGLNWLGSYNEYGLNVLFLENYWNGGAPATQERYFDNFVVSRQPIGCGTSAPPPPPPPPTLQAVELTPSTISLQVGGTAQFSAIGRMSDGSTQPTSVLFTATGGSINSSGFYTAGSVAGSYSVIALQAGGSIADTAAVTIVNAPPAPVSTVSVQLAASSLTAGQTTQATATLRDVAGNLLTGRAIAWSSSNASIATVNASGLVTAQAAGTATITATSEGKSGGASLTVTSQAPAPVATVVVTPSSATITVGSTAQLSATLRDATGAVLTGRIVTWASSNQSRAIVNATGLVTAVSPGAVTITATSEGKSGSSNVTVPTPPPTLQSVVVTPASASLGVGQTQSFSAVGRMSDGSTQPVTVTWSATGGTITSAGLYTAGSSAGTYRVIAQQSGGSLADTSSVTITAPQTGQTGLDFLGNADGRSTIMAWNLARTGVAPFAKFPATYIWRAYPRSGQQGYWTSLFHASWQGPGTFTVSKFYYGMHPYPWSPIAWEISMGSNDQPENASQRAAVDFNRWYTQVVTIDANAKITFYYDWDAGRSYTYQDVDRPEPDPAIIVGDAPWNPGNEIYYGVLRGFQYYDAVLTPSQIAQELANPGSSRTPWYLNLNPTPTDITDKSGNGHNPQWMTPNRPRLWTQP